MGMSSALAWFHSDQLDEEGRQALGYIDEADLSSWLLAIDRLKQRYPKPAVVYPGHGKGGSIELLDHTHALVEGGLRPAD